MGRWWRRRPIFLVPIQPTARCLDGDRPLPIADLWRQRFDGRLGELVVDMQERAEVALELKESHLDALSYTTKPKGIPVAELDTGEAEILRELIGCYLGRLADELADRQASLVDQEFDRLAFVWAGGVERGEPHYYRIQGQRIFIEYDNTQRGANHIHAVWRDLANDFGGDVLARHYADSPH